MPVARIITRHASHESEALKALSEQLSAAGYEVEIVPPGADSAAADLVVELDEVPVAEALEAAMGMAREADTDVYIAPGLFAQPAMRAHSERTQLPTPSHAARGEKPIVEAASAPEVHISGERSGVIGSTLEELGAALAEGGVGIGGTVSGMRARAAEAWSQWQQRRADATQARCRERERRGVERRRQHEAELQRRAEEQQQLLTERERLAEEQEPRRLAALQAEHVRAQREQAAQRAAAMGSERRQPEPPRPVEIPAPPLPAEISPPAPEPVYADAAPVFRPKRVRRPRRIPSARERQWQRAAVLASIAALVAMLGFAFATNMRSSSPLPASLIQNQARQEVPFGPAKMDVTSAGRPARVAPPTQATPPRTWQKPSPAKPTPPRRARRVSRGSDIVAEDEVIVRHPPTSHAQRAQTTTGVRRYSDEN